MVRRSRCEAEEAFNERGLAGNNVLRQPSALSLPKHVHCFDSLKRSTRIEAIEIPDSLGPGASRLGDPVQLLVASRAGVRQFRPPEAQNGEKLRVFMTDRAGTSPLVVLSAQTHAARLLAAAGVETSWRLCEASSLLPGREPCFQSGALSIAVRLLPLGEAKLWPIERSSCGLALSGASGEHGFLAIIPGNHWMQGASAGLPDPRHRPGLPCLGTSLRMKWAICWLGKEATAHRV